MLAGHVFGLLLNPVPEWHRIKSDNKSLPQVITYLLVLAALPVLAAYIGSTQFGWRVGASEPVRLTQQSAVGIAIAYYAVIVVATLSIGWMIHWMGQTYGSTQPLSQCLALAVFIPTPMFLVGMFQAIPVVWINLLVSMPALAYTTFLLYTGIPVFMEIPSERGFLFASAVLAVGLVGLVGLLAVTAILWGIGIGPVFTN